MDWKRFFDGLGFNGSRWQWRMMRWERNLRGLFRGQGLPGSAGISVTRIIITLNLVFFTAMVLQGTAAGQGFRPLFNPDTYLLVHSGAQFWPLVIYEGEWWRCLTYAFAHGGLIHIGFNMVVLYQVGPLIEREIGRDRFITLYTLTALTATALGYVWHPMTPVVGASGSLFGLIGFAVTYYHRIGPAGLQIRNFMFKWAVFAFVFGLMVGADNAGHLGGALGGAALGWVLPTGVRGQRATDPYFKILSLLCSGAVLLSLVMLVLSWFSR